MKAHFQIADWSSVLRFLAAGSLFVLSLTAGAAPSPSSQALSAATTRFAFALTRELQKEKPGEDVFISPYSISAALQLVRAGAAGKTRKEMDEVLGAAGLDGMAAAQAYKDLEQAIRTGSSNAVLSIANAIWYAPRIELKPEFVSLNQSFYDAKLAPLDFTDPRASGMVNAWVNDATHGKIARLIEGPMSGMTGAFLANAIYFKGTWEKQFDQKETQERLFNLAYGQQKTVPMMRQKREFVYQEAPDFQAVSLAYSGSHLAMCVLLPGTNSSPQKLLSGLSAELWRETIIPKFARRDGTLLLPRFKMEYTAELKKSLLALGMRRAFAAGAADFSAMSSTPLLVDSVKHKSYVEVNEEGTEAAAVTGVTMKMTAVMPAHQAFQMIVDRPFLFVIEDTATHTILFLGMVLNLAGS